MDSIHIMPKEYPCFSGQFALDHNAGILKKKCIVVHKENALETRTHHGLQFQVKEMQALKLFNLSKEIKVLFVKVIKEPDAEWFVLERSL